jgi:hypothetical protein
MRIEVVSDGIEPVFRWVPKGFSGFKEKDAEKK